MSFFRRTLKTIRWSFGVGSLYGVEQKQANNTRTHTQMCKGVVLSSNLEAVMLSWDSDTYQPETITGFVFRGNTFIFLCRLEHELSRERS